MISRDLTGPLALFVSFSALKDYGVDKVFELENNNTDSTQHNIVFLVQAEKVSIVQAVAGKSRVFLLIGTYKEIARDTFLPFAYQSSSLN